MDTIGSSPSRHRPLTLKAQGLSPCKGGRPSVARAALGWGASACKESACLEGRMPALMGGRLMPYVLYWVALP